LLLFLAGCGFQHGSLGATADGQNDATGVFDAAIDAAIDAAVDARSLDAYVPPQPVTTNHGSVADTFIASDSGLTDTNFNDQTSALVDGDVVRNVLIRFDLSSISTTSTVSAATMHIWTDYDPGGPVTIYPVLESWNEGEVTWSSRAAGQAWSSAGAMPPSRGTTSVGSVTPSTASTEYSITIDTATVAGWVADPGTNDGLVFTTDQADGTRFSTREFVTATSRPYLAVTHVP
jgi:hypothetical protein